MKTVLDIIKDAKQKEYEKILILNDYPDFIVMLNNF